MTIKELERILVYEKIPHDRYEITGSDYLKGYDGFIILKGDNGKWLLYYMERGQKDLLKTCNNEHQVCVEFLKEFTDSYKNLQKYIPKSEIE